LRRGRLRKKLKKHHEKIGWKIQAKKKPAYFAGLKSISRRRIEETGEIMPVRFVFVQFIFLILVI
jgi:hypothetical protein